MPRIMKYEGDGSQFIEGIPARKILLKDWELLPEQGRAHAEATGLYKSGIGDAEPITVRVPGGADKLSPQQILDRVDAAVLALNGEDSRNWSQADIESGAEKKPLVQRLALLASRMGNDPHNQEIGQVLLEDYAKNQGWNRDRLLVACAHHTAVHRKYGNPLDCATRFGEAMGIARLQ